MSAPGRPEGEYRSAQHDGSPASTDDRAHCAALAALLRGWGSVASLGLLLSAIAWGALGWTDPPAPASFAWAVAALAGIVERLFWLRLQLDRGLFEALANGTIDSLDALDRALDGLGLRRSTTPAPRPLELRIRGTRRLVAKHAVAVCIQAAAGLVAVSFGLLESS